MTFRAQLSKNRIRSKKAFDFAALVRRGLGNQRGQGVIEYILVLVVVVGIIVGVLFQFSDAFRSWANNYFGEYLACLLETGELPSVGGLGGSGGLCNQYFEPFSLANGRPPKENPSTPYEPAGGGDGSSGTGGSSGKSSSNRSNSGQSEGVSYSNGASGRSGSSNRFLAKKATAGESISLGSRASSGSGQDKLYTGSTSNSLPAGYQRGGDNSTIIKVDRSRLDRSFQQERPQAQDMEQRISVQNQGVEDKKNQDKVLIKRELASEKKVDADTSMSFGDYLRYLIIAAIIIALVVFLGGQALQIGKSMD